MTCKRDGFSGTGGMWTTAQHWPESRSNTYILHTYTIISFCITGQWPMTDWCLTFARHHQNHCSLKG